jgi:aspartate--ammonia ligase
MKNQSTFAEFKDLQEAIQTLKEEFGKNLSKELNLTKVSAPLFVESDRGINDDLNGIEKPVSFKISALNHKNAEVVQSLAKWKRMTLSEHQFPLGSGLFADLVAIRPDDTVDSTHSILIDQWDWELAISEEQRNIEFLKNTVKKIYSALLKTEKDLCLKYTNLTKVLPDEVFFIHSQQLLDMYPQQSPKERENSIAKKHKAVFIMGIGSKLSNGEAHDLRAPDYDDWTSKNEDSFFGLNGDLIVYHPNLDAALELSSMGIRVHKEALLNQLEITETLGRTSLDFHQKLVQGKLGFSIGGGIGQSRVAMFLLNKSHIKEVQKSFLEFLKIYRCVFYNSFVF